MSALRPDAPARARPGDRGGDLAGDGGADVCTTGTPCRASACAARRALTARVSRAATKRLPAPPRRMARAADTPTPTFGPASTLSDQSASVVMSTPRLGGCMSKRPPGGRKEPRMAATEGAPAGGCP